MENEYFVVRTYSAGVFVGTISKRDGKEIVLNNAIRLWYWSGANSLSQLAMEGVKNPHKCKFAMPVNQVILTEAVEILLMTEEAIDNILNVPSWKL